MTLTMLTTATTLGVGVLDTETLQLGLVAGSLAVLVSGVLALWLPKSRPGVVGIPMAIAAVYTLRHQLPSAGFPVVAIAAMLLCGAATELLARVPQKSWWLYASYLPGIVALTSTPVARLSTATRFSVAVAAAVSAVAFSDFDRRHARDGMAIPLLVTASVATMFMARGNIAGPAVFASLVPFCILLFPRPQARFGDAGVGCAVTVYWWSTALIVNGSGPRIVGAWMAMGFLLLEPAARRFLPKALRPSRHNDRDSRWLVLATAVVSQSVLVWYGVVVVARRPLLDMALLVALPIVLVGTIIATAVAPTPRRRKSRSRDQATLEG